MSLQPLVVDRLPVIGAIGYHRTDLALNLVQQIRERRDIADIIRGQFHRGNLLRIGVNREMQLTPAPARPDPVLLIKPFALTVDLHPVLSISRCKGSFRSTRCGNTVNPPPRRLNVVWSGIGRSRPSRPTIDLIAPSVWRSGWWNTRRRARPVLIATPEKPGWPPRLPVTGACQAASASSVIQSVKLPRRTRAAS